MTEQPRRDVLGEIFEAVLFDNDSTLTDSKASVERSWELWAHRYGLPIERLRDTHGMPSRQIITRIAPELDLEEATAAFGRLELQHLDDVSTVPGALEALRTVGDRAAIVTSAGRVLLQRRLEAAGIPSVAVMVTAEDVSHGKPAPDPYLEGARRLGVDPRRCLVVEDAVAGLRSAKRPAPRPWPSSRRPPPTSSVRQTSSSTTWPTCGSGSWTGECE